MNLSPTDSRLSCLVLPALLKHLQDNDYIWVSEKLKRNLNVDNIVSSFSSEAEVLSYLRDTRDLMSSAGFNLRSWNSISNNLRKLASAENVLDAYQVTKVLGMFWDAEKNKLFLRLNPIQKRDVSPNEISYNRHQKYTIILDISVLSQLRLIYSCKRFGSKNTTGTHHYL